MVPSISNATLVNHNSVSLSCHHRWQVHRSICEKWAVQMGGATKHSFISAYFLLNTYFLTAQSYKLMRLTTRVYGISPGYFPHIFSVRHHQANIICHARAIISRFFWTVSFIFRLALAVRSPIRHV